MHQGPNEISQSCRHIQRSACPEQRPSCNKIHNKKSHTSKHREPGPPALKPEHRDDTSSAMQEPIPFFFFSQKHSISPISFSSDLPLFFSIPLPSSFLFSSSSLLFSFPRRPLPAKGPPVLGPPTCEADAALRGERHLQKRTSPRLAQGRNKKK